jgi:sulfite exporter TauE/SafE
VELIPIAGTALLLGALGSVHCAAMCGGIAGALSMARGGANDGRARLQHACYGAGRVTSYTVAGAFAGSLGLVLGSAIGPTGSRALRVLAALVLALLGFQLAGYGNALAPLERLGGAAWRRIAPLLSLDRKRTSVLTSLAVGAVWGWLPCGLVYSTLAWAGAAGDPVQAAVAMAAFGVGTLPSVWLVGVGAARFARIARARPVRGLAGAVVVATALWTLSGALLAGGGDRPSCHDEPAAARSVGSEVEHGVHGDAVFRDVLAVER